MTDPTLDARQVRAARNQSLFREVNERLEQLNEAFAIAPAKADFVCECADLDCVDSISMPLHAYRTLRQVPAHFAVGHGHVDPAVERVVEEHDGFVVVEKFGVAGLVAAAARPLGASVS